MIRGKKIKPKGNNGKRQSLIQRKNGNLKKKREVNKWPVLSGDLKSSKEVVCQLREEPGGPQLSSGAPRLFSQACHTVLETVVGMLYGYI